MPSARSCDLHGHKFRLCDLRSETRVVARKKKHPHFPITLAYRKCKNEISTLTILTLIVTIAYYLVLLHKVLLLKGMKLPVFMGQGLGFANWVLPKREFWKKIAKKTKANTVLTNCEMKTVLNIMGYWQNESQFVKR